MMNPETGRSANGTPYPAYYRPRSRRRRSEDRIVIVIVIAVLLLNPLSLLLAFGVYRCDVIGSCTGGGLTPLGTALGFDFAGVHCSGAGTRSGCNYSFPVIAVAWSPTVSFSDVRLRILGPTGAVYLRAAVEATLFANASGCDLGRLDLGSGTWAPGGGPGCGTAPPGFFVANSTLLLRVPGPSLSGRGLALVGFSVGPNFEGELETPIP